MPTPFIASSLPSDSVAGRVSIVFTKPVDGEWIVHMYPANLPWKLKASLLEELRVAISVQEDLLRIARSTQNSLSQDGD